MVIKRTSRRRKKRLPVAVRTARALEEFSAAWWQVAADDALHQVDGKFDDLRVGVAVPRQVKFAGVRL
jgi:hypothetical protein